MLQELTQLLTPISIVIASITAIYGINSWRREAKWKRSYQLAEDVLVQVYQVRDSFRSIRAPFRFGEEISSDNSKEEQHVINVRYQKEKEVFAKLQSLKYRFMALHGPENEKLFLKIDILVTELFRAAHSMDTKYSREYKEQSWQSEIEKTKFLDRMHEIQNIISRTDETDPFDQKVQALVSEFQEICQKIIQGSFRSRAIW